MSRSMRQYGALLLKGILGLMVVYVAWNAKEFMKPSNARVKEDLATLRERTLSKTTRVGTIAAGEGDATVQSGEMAAAQPGVKRRKIKRSKNKSKRDVLIAQKDEDGDVSKLSPPQGEDDQAGSALASAGEVKRQPRTYAADCKWEYSEEQQGYPGVAFHGAVGNFVCPSMFRDISDFVYGWPYAHFGETVFTTDRRVSVSNLPPVPIIYSHVDYVRKGELAPFLKGLKQPYILITGQSDWPVPSTEHSREILRDSNLVRWFAQNNDAPHPKITPIPIGLNCFEHGPEMHQVLDSKQLTSSSQPRSQLVLVNFGHTHSSRDAIWSSLCTPEHGAPFATCKTKATSNNIKGNPHLVTFYEEMSEFKYVVCPRGNGIDTHRVWEALYLGVVPIVLRSSLDPLYAGLPILLVDDFSEVTKDMLESRWPRFEEEMRQRRQAAADNKLSRAYWWKLVEATRTQALLERGLTDVSPRKRCWGPA